ncbi:type III secretion system inner membrane ring subunit SctD [Candidatus Fukatsuia symbiotica]|uniref:EscD/YscD/HrpQ family type III secretion system inner membrane ring protein n=1 Tax=Candidatus Fukatsuia symbiotica TaxID=1878942 RepID=A0A2U8I4D7_9GAMM|nr:type III secretion system inner membrane ring subunit SctD [Candidatus Fukatsuia symbiotica]AWK13979.1 EscD/YscD/HrpQ family type III secretion system inner membrane ring protein [Candidatus Fukatsuia symbiotica]MEA9445676.1 type III secretion system inner membrane ring subunit SctD [Candidatus Fukatsuia symbiotica]
MNAQLKVRLLNGELNGREVRLPAGDFTLGEQGCDVLLPLQKGEILILKVAENQVFMQAPGRVWVNGRVFDVKNALPLHQVIEASGVMMVLGEHNDTLSGISIPSSSGRGSLLLLSGCALLLLLVVSIGLFWLSGHHKVDESDQPTGIESQLAHQLQLLKLKDIKSSWQPDGSVQLSGYCLSSEAMRRLQNFLTMNAVVYRNELVCDDHLIVSVSDVLRQYGYQDAEVSEGNQPGRVTIHGTIQAGPQWKKVQDVLTAMPGLQGWNVINHDGELLQLLVGKLRSSGLLGYLSLTQNKKNIVISGQLSGEQQQKLNNILTVVHQEQPDFLPIVYQNIPASDQSKQLLPAEIVSYGGNQESAFMELANGLRLQQGTILPNGYKVIFLSAHGIQLMRGNNLVHIPLDF